MIDAVVFGLYLVFAFIFVVGSAAIFKKEIFYENEKLRHQNKHLNERLDAALQVVQTESYCNSLWRDKAVGVRFRLSMMLQELGMIKSSVESMQEIAKSAIEGIDAVESETDEVGSDSGFVGESEQEESDVSNEG